MISRSRLFLPFLLAIIAIFSLPSAQRPLAAELTWSSRVISYRSVNQDIAVVLQNLSASANVPIMISSRVEGTFNGDITDKRYAEALDFFSLLYNLIWYFDGTVVHVYSIDETSSAFFSIGNLSSAEFNDILASLDIDDERYPLRTNDEIGIVTVSGPPRYVELILRTAELVAANQDVEVETRHFVLKHASVDDREFSVRGENVNVPGVATILRELLEGETGTLSVSAPDAGEDPIVAITDYIKNLEAGGSEESGAGQALAGLRVSPALSRRFPDLPVISVDSRRNAIVIKDLKNRIGMYEDLIELLDQAVRQIRIEVIILDINTEQINELGIDWQLTDGDDNSIGVATLPERVLDPSGLLINSVISLSPVRLLSRIRALERKGDAQILSRPAILTLDNLQAVFDENESFFVRLEGDEAVDLVEITTGVLLRVRPRIIDQGRAPPLVQMTIDVEDGSSRLGSGDSVVVVDDIPTVRRSQISTESYVLDGQSLAIGGFYREKVVDNVDQVPILSSIPIIGSAFRNTTKETENIVRLFLIRPTIITVDKPEASARVEEEGPRRRDGPVPLLPLRGASGRQGIGLPIREQRDAICASIERHGYSCSGGGSAVEGGPKPGARY
ncbi:MAG: type III secretion system outer membrane ring subunit SctC [Geminicoccaceae bacterium]